MCSSKFFKTPLKRAIAFLIFPLSFYLADYLNYVRAFKIALIGLLVIGTLSSWIRLFKKNKVIKILLVIMSAIIFLNMSFHAGLRDIFGVAQNDLIVMQAIFGTDSSEGWEFILQYKRHLLKHLSVFLLSFGLYYLFVLRCEQIISDRANVKKTALIFTLLLVIVHFNSTMRRSDPLFYFPYFHAEWKADILATEKLSEELGKNLSSSQLSSMHYTDNGKKRTMVWVIGESDTKYNWSLYGYKRETNPKMESLKDELLVFNNIFAAAPITVPAFQRMLTAATLEKPDLWKKEPDILLMAKQAGYHVYWISNHTTDAFSIMNIFASHADEVILTNKGKARGEGSMDETLLAPYRKALDDDYDKKFIIVHLLGSHPAYNFRYPKSYGKFTYQFDDPVMQKLKSKGRAQWALVFRNLYDNSILYSDMVRYELLSMLKNSKDAEHGTWLYIPDHGEDVCHNSNFSGHNYQAIEQWEIPMLFWSSLNDGSIDKNITERFYRMDMMNDTILGLLDIDGAYYHPQNDLFSEQCECGIVKDMAH
jgi:heptose-I-phosphate ethanolaminephosphotransferase